MRKVINIVYYWLPPVIWMGIIFYMSSQKSVASGVNLAVDFITFKSLHLVEYAFLFFLLYRAFHSLIYLKQRFFGLFAFPIAMLYSLTDELHQLSVPTRSGRLRDVFIDIAGMIIMYGIIKKIPYIKKLL
jgi:VanZ family protein